MVGIRKQWLAGLAIVLLAAAVARGQQVGGITGMVRDADYDDPLGAVEVMILETQQKAVTSGEGIYSLDNVAAGKYTLVFRKDGYVKKLVSDVVVAAGAFTDRDAALSAQVTEMEEFVVQDIELDASKEGTLLNIRIEAPSMQDSIGAELMSRIGASTAIDAVRAVAGASVQDGKFAVIRGLPDRYVNSQMNGVRLPTADAEKRAVELDQFPAAMIESVRITKTFTPDQQGDASGGAVNVVLKGIPQDPIVLKFSVQSSYNTRSAKSGQFLTYKGGGLDFWGKDDGSRDIQSEWYDPTPPPRGGGDGLYNGAAGVSRGDAPEDYKWNFALGGRHDFDNGLTIGGLTSVFYEQGSSFRENAVDDRMWVLGRGQPMTPLYRQGAPGTADQRTSLFDVTQGTQEVKWGALAVLGAEIEDHSITLLYMTTHVAEDIATLGEDTRGKQYYYPGFDRNDITSPGYFGFEGAPYLRNETLEYTERTTDTLQLRGRHKLPTPELGDEGIFRVLRPEIDWTLARSSASLYQPDKRQFGTEWQQALDLGIPGFPPLVPATHYPFKESVNINLGNMQRIWKDINEQSEQYFINLKLPFEMWHGEEGYLKLGFFNDDLKRTYRQDSFSNFEDVGAQYAGDWEDYWSAVFPDEVHRVTPSATDVDYDGEQHIKALYWMLDIPVTEYFRLIGGVRREYTELSISNDADVAGVDGLGSVTWFPPGATTPQVLNPGDANVSFKRVDMLPSIGFVLEPFDKLSFRASYTETVARQTFRELTPIQQTEYLGADIFIGNPGLQMSEVKNYDLRVDYRPYDGGLLSVSWFKKDIAGPIEYVQRSGGIGFIFTYPENYPSGELTGWEFEMRHSLGQFWDPLEGLSIGANATFIDSQVMLPADEAARLAAANFPMTSRHMTNAPEQLYNMFLTYDLERTGTQFSVFYTVRGDTLVAGATARGAGAGATFIPSVYEAEYGTLNMSLSQKLGKYFQVKLQAKNLTDPAIEQVYRSRYINGDVVKTSYHKGIDLSLGVSFKYEF